MIVTALHNDAFAAGTPVEQVVLAAGTAGFDGVAIDVPGAALAGGAPDLIRRLRASALPVLLLTSRDFQTCTLTHRPDKARSLAKALLEVGAAVGATTVEIGAGGVGGGHDGIAVGYREALNATYDGMVDLVPEAERRGVRLALSTVARGFLRSPVELRDLIERINSAAAGVAVHFEGIAGDALDWLRILGPKVFEVRGANGLSAATSSVRGILDGCGADATLTFCGPGEPGVAGPLLRRRDVP